VQNSVLLTDTGYSRQAIETKSPGFKKAMKGMQLQSATTPSFTTSLSSKDREIRKAAYPKASKHSSNYPFRTECQPG